MWNELGLCVPECVNAGESGIFNEELGHCECSDGFQYSMFESACYILCYDISNARDEEGPTPTSCNCNRGYSWNDQDTACDLNCNGPFDTGVNEDGTECVCETNAMWDSRKKQCGVLCSADPLSTGFFVTDRCNCTLNAMWNDQINECQCSQGFVEGDRVCVREETSSSSATAPIAAAAGALISGAAVGVGMKIRQKRQKAKDQEKIVDLGGESVKGESAKEICQENKENVI